MLDKEKTKEIEELKNQMLQLKEEVSFIKVNESKYMSKINETNGSSMSQFDATMTEKGIIVLNNQQLRRFLLKIQ